MCPPKPQKMPAQLNTKESRSMHDVALMDWSEAGWRGDNSQDALSLCMVAVLVRAGASQNKEGCQSPCCPPLRRTKM